MEFIMAVQRNNDALGLDYARKFTASYQEGSKQNTYIREMLCEDVQFPAVLVSPRTTDLLCGKRLYPEVGYSVQYGGLGYYCNPRNWQGEQATVQYSEEELSEWNRLSGFWAKEATWVKCRNEYDPEFLKRLPGIFGAGTRTYPAYCLYRMAGLQLDYGKLITQGLAGLEANVLAAEASAHNENAAAFYAGALASVHRLRRCIEHYLSEAEKLPVSDKSARMKNALAGLLDHAPATLHEGLQLILIASTMSGTINFGRLDTVLGSILCKELNDGTLTWDQALELMQNFYTIIEEEILHFDGRIIVGGMGRADEETADRFAMLAMETTDSLNLPMPQLSLRFYKGQNPALLEKAYDIIGRGKTFPMLYNDDVNVPAVEKAFKVERKTAEQYLPFGCGEYMINHASCGTPNFIINLQRCLELAIHNGRCLTSGKEFAPDFGSLMDYPTFDELWKAYSKTVDYFLEAGAQAQSSIYRTTGRECPYSLISLLYDDCIERGRPILDGGVRYLGGTNETYGNNNAADSLTAIHELIFKNGKYAAAELLNALKTNWEGHDEMRSDFKNAPKFGNDDDLADEMVKRVHTQICTGTSDAATPTGLHHFLVVIINNNYNTVWGKCTSASADGRKHGEPLAPGNSAGAGCDRNGLTALLNSQAKSDPSIHAGAVQNVKLSAGLPGKHPDLYRALFRGYFKQGGAQTMVTVTSRADLLAALEHPENYANLLVRVGGFSARFIDLDPATQQEILSRTEHEG
jgi:pyruvate-formate lyase